MKVIRAREDDLARVMEIYSLARNKMRESGNPTQWINYPTEEIVKKDIIDSNLFAVENKGEVVGVFALIEGEDPTYRTIEGKWINDESYATLHRIASCGKAHGVFEACFDFCRNRVKNLRIDTHRDNVQMLHLLEKFGFSRCGIIYTRGSPRIAFQIQF